MRQWIGIVGVCALFGALVGCGGAGGSSTDGGGSSGGSIALTSSLAAVNYGDPVTIRWSSSHLRSIADSNFGVGSDLLNGSITDHPATDTVYAIKGTDTNGESHVSTVTIQVRPSTKSFLVVGDASVSGVSQVKQYLESITTGSVTVSLTLPASPTADAVVFLESGHVGPADHATVTSYLASGHGVVLVGLAPRTLATGSTASDDISSIGSWFVGALHQGGDGLHTGFLTNSTLPGFPLSVTLKGANIGGGIDIRPVSSSAILVSQAVNGGADAFAYEPSGGGRVVYVSAFGPGTTDAELKQKAAFLAGCRWSTILP